MVCAKCRLVVVRMLWAVKIFWCLESVLDWHSVGCVMVIPAPRSMRIYAGGVHMFMWNFVCDGSNDSGSRFDCRRAFLHCRQ